MWSRWSNIVAGRDRASPEARFFLFLGNCLLWVIFSDNA